jgi:RimJ/RimL family protein N-acetyltransferase
MISMAAQAGRPSKNSSCGAQVEAGFRVRRATDDAAVAAAAEVDVAVAPEGFLGIEPPVDAAERVRRHAEVAVSPAGGLWVLEDEGTAVGYGTLHEHRPGVLSVGMALLSSARGRGGGRALLGALIEHARRSEAHKLDLEVWLENGRAIALYTNAGFSVEGVRHNHYRRRDGRLRSSMLMAIHLRS